MRSESDQVNEPNKNHTKNKHSVRKNRLCWLFLLDAIYEKKRRRTNKSQKRYRYDEVLINFLVLLFYLFLSLFARLNNFINTSWLLIFRKNVSKTTKSLSVLPICFSFREHVILHEFTSNYSILVFVLPNITFYYIIRSDLDILMFFLRIKITRTTKQRRNVK